MSSGYLLPIGTFAYNSATSFVLITMPDRYIEHDLRGFAWSRLLFPPLLCSPPHGAGEPLPQVQGKVGPREKYCWKSRMLPSGSTARNSILVNVDHCFMKLNWKWAEWLFNRSFRVAAWVTNWHR